MPRNQIFPRTNLPAGTFTTPAVEIEPAAPEFIVWLDPDHDYPTCVWSMEVQWTFNNGTLWQHWRSFGSASLVLGSKGNYPAIGGTFPPGEQPTHLRAVVTLSEPIRVGLLGDS